MDIQPQSTQPISDDQELAKVLAGVNGTGDATSNTTTAMSDISAPVAAGEPPVAETVVPAPIEIPTPPDLSPQEFSSAPNAVASPGSGDLDSVKLDAINELRPLVDKLSLSPEEKFDTYLLLIRSTDDKSLVAPAHEAAKTIADEARRAQALLDIIKEIDFLSQAK